MPYRIEIHGLSVSCDTAQELSALVRVAGINGPRNVASSSDIGSDRSVELYTKLEESERENAKLRKMLEDAPVQPTLLFGRGVWANYRREAMKEIHAMGPVKAARVSELTGGNPASIVQALRTWPLFVYTDDCFFDLSELGKKVAAKQSGSGEEADDKQLSQSQPLNIRELIRASLSDDRLSGDRKTVLEIAADLAIDWERIEEVFRADQSLPPNDRMFRQIGNDWKISE